MPHTKKKKKERKKEKKRKLQANITDEDRCKNPQQNIIKPNLSRDHDQVDLSQGCKDGPVSTN